MVSGNHNVQKSTLLRSRRSYSYSSGLSSISSNSDRNKLFGKESADEFTPLTLQKSIDVLPIPPTAPNKPLGLSQFNRLRKNKSKKVTNTQNNVSVQNAENNNFDMVSPEYSGSFFDNVAIRSHSYTSLSRLQKLAEFNSDQQQQQSNGG